MLWNRMYFCLLKNVIISYNLIFCIYHNALQPAPKVITDFFLCFISVTFKLTSMNTSLHIFRLDFHCLLYPPSLQMLFLSIFLTKQKQNLSYLYCKYDMPGIWNPSTNVFENIEYNAIDLKGHENRYGRQKLQDSWSLSFN